MLPKILYVFKDADPNNEEDSWFIVDEEMENCVNQHGPTVVGTYELKRTESVTLIVKAELKTEPVPPEDSPFHTGKRRGKEIADKHPQ